MELSNKKPFPVKIGAITLYCEKMTLDTKTDIMTCPSITGFAYYTNKARKPTYLSFTGRLYNKKQPLLYVGIANNINGSEMYEIKYKNLKFTSCIITGIHAVDSDEDYIDLTIEAATLSTASFLYDEVTE